MGFLIIKIKKMKIYKIILIFTLCSVITGCNDDFLDQPDMDIILTDNFWRSAKDLELYVNQFYPSFPTLSGFSGGIYWADANSDNMVTDVANTRLLGNNTINTNGSWTFKKVNKKKHYKWKQPSGLHPLGGLSFCTASFHLFL